MWITLCLEKSTHTIDLNINKSAQSGVKIIVLLLKNDSNNNIDSGHIFIALEVLIHKRGFIDVQSVVKSCSAPYKYTWKYNDVVKAILIYSIKLTRALLISSYDAFGWIACKNSNKPAEVSLATRVDNTISSIFNSSFDESVDILCPNFLISQILILELSPFKSFFSVDAKKIMVSNICLLHANAFEMINMSWITWERMPNNGLISCWTFPYEQFIGAIIRGWISSE